jgi:hypothetical protein
VDDRTVDVPEHAALLGGVLAGMGIVGGVFAVELLLWERARAVRLMSTPGLRTELYVRPA